MYSEKAIALQKFTKEEVLPWLPTMNEECARSLGEFPYLYAPNKDQLVNPTDTIYVNEQESLVVIAKNADKTIGIAAGIALSSYYLTAHYFSLEIIEKFREKGYQPENIWYMGYFLMHPDYQNDAELIHEIYDIFVDTAKKLGKTQICYIDVIRSDTHPLRSKTYTHPEPYGHMIPGFTRTEVEIESTWPTFQSDGTIKNETHQLVYFIRVL